MIAVPTASYFAVTDCSGSANAASTAGDDRHYLWFCTIWLKAWGGVDG